MADEPVELSGELVELRGEIPREYADTLDAKAIARSNGANRMTILREILGAWHRQQVHEATLVLRVNRGPRKPGGSERKRPDASGTDRGALT